MKFSHVATLMAGILIAPHLKPDAAGMIAMLWVIAAVVTGMFDK